MCVPSVTLHWWSNGMIALHMSALPYGFSFNLSSKHALVNMLDMVFTCSEMCEGRIDRLENGTVRWILYRILAIQENLHEAT